MSKEGSPVPVTRVERVDDEPANGEVPGTDAHEARKGDAQPDEIAVVPDQESRPASSAASEDVPATVVEEAPGSTAPHSEEFQSKRQADATPDKVIDAEGDVKVDSSPDGHSGMGT